MSKEQLKELRDLIDGESTEIAVLIAEASPTLIEEIDRLSMALEQADHIACFELKPWGIEANSGSSDKATAPELAEYLRARMN